MKNSHRMTAFVLGLCSTTFASYVSAASLGASAAGTGTTGSGISGGSTPNSGTNSNSTGATGTANVTPNDDTIVDNAKPNDLPLPNAGARTTTDNPSAKISFGHVESVNSATHTVRIRDSQGHVSNVVVSQGVVYGNRNNSKTRSGFSDIKAGDNLHYSIGSNGQASQINWDNTPR